LPLPLRQIEGERRRGKEGKRSKGKRETREKKEVTKHKTNDWLISFYKNSFFIVVVLLVVIFLLIPCLHSLSHSLPPSSTSS